MDAVFIGTVGLVLMVMLIAIRVPIAYSMLLVGIGGVWVLSGPLVLLSQLEICDDYNLYYDLYRVDSRGRRTRLTECGRHRFAAPLEDGRIVVVRLAGVTAEVAVLDAAGKPQRTLYRAAAGESIVGLAAKGDAVVISTRRSTVPNA